MVHGSRILGLYRDNGKEHGDYYSILGLYRPKMLRERLMQGLFMNGICQTSHHAASST